MSNTNDDALWEEMGRRIEREVLVCTIHRLTTENNIVEELEKSKQEVIANQSTDAENFEIIKILIENVVKSSTQALLEDIANMKEQDHE